LVIEEYLHGDVCSIWIFKLDKIGLGGTGKGRKASGLSRPHSETDFVDLEEQLQFSQPPLTKEEVEEKFLQMLDDMNLSEEKRQPLLEQSIDKKRQLLSMREKGYTTVCSGDSSRMDIRRKV
jgi:hypothetical protein